MKPNPIKRYSRKLGHRIRSLYHRLQHQFPNPPTEPAPTTAPVSHILRLPAEILDEVHKYLEPLDQTCLALSCNRFYMHYCSFCKVPGLRLPDFFPDSRPLLCTNLQERPRVQLLRRLEDTHWRFCHGCWSLHPRSVWHSTPISLPKPTRLPRRGLVVYNRSGRPELPPLPPVPCIPQAGVVDICPCLSLSFNDVSTIINSLSPIPGMNWTTQRTYFETLLRLGQDFQNRILRHECRITGDLVGEAEIATGFCLRGDGRTLSVGNSYLIRMFTPLRPLPRGRGPLFGVESDVVVWLGRFVSDLALGLEDVGGRSVAVSRGRVQVTELLSGDLESRVFEVMVHRTLGKGDEPGADWERWRRV